VVSDLSEFHRIDLVTVLRDESVSPRMLWARIRGLPDSSALHASIRGEPRGWGTDRHLTATVIDAIQNNTWATIAVATKRKPRKFKPVKRPKSKKKQTVVSVAQLAGRGEHGRSGR
jgi:hypothetical protein